MTESHIKTLVFTTLDILQLNKVDNYENIYSVNLLCLLVNQASGYIDEKNGNKYLIFDSRDENKKLLKKTMMLGMELKTKSKK